MRKKRDRIRLCDVGPAELATAGPPATAPVVAALARALAAAGVPTLELAALGPGDPAPSLPDEVLALSDSVAGIVQAVQVTDAAGYARARRPAIGAVHVALGVTESLERALHGRSIDDGLAAASEVAAQARADGRPTTLRLIGAFGCPFEGAVDEGAVYDLAGRAASVADVVVLADSVGTATPGTVTRQVGRCTRTLRQTVGVRLSDTRGAAIANALAAIEAGATVVETAIGGVGVGGVGGVGRAVPHVHGDVPTEDLAWVLERDGIETGVDLDALVRAARRLAGELGHELPGRVWRVGGGR